MAQTLPRPRRFENGLPPILTPAIWYSGRCTVNRTWSQIEVEGVKTLAAVIVLRTPPYSNCSEKIITSGPTSHKRSLWYRHHESSRVSTRCNSAVPLEQIRTIMLGTGIQAPVTVTESCDRAGLGRDSASGLISFQNAHHVIRDYAASASTDELTFTPELTNPERARIHKMCRRYGLKSKSYNKGDVRYLVVSRKVSAMDLVDQLKASGGTKGNLQLLTLPNKNQSPSAFND